MHNHVNIITIMYECAQCKVPNSDDATTANVRLQASLSGAFFQRCCHCCYRFCRPRHCHHHCGLLQSSQPAKTVLNLALFYPHALTTLLHVVSFRCCCQRGGNMAPSAPAGCRRAVHPVQGRGAQLRDTWRQARRCVQRHHVGKWCATCFPTSMSSHSFHATPLNRTYWTLAFGQP